MENACLQHALTCSMQPTADPQICLYYESLSKGLNIDSRGLTDIEHLSKCYLFYNYLIPLTVKLSIPRTFHANKASLKLPTVSSTRVQERLNNQHNLVRQAAVMQWSRATKHS
ncbi:hypothetical protein EVAR_68284_1 [Eumeta japonica]|uniref:Uncharacterized protein n=1 Tax=Eumeta variegata TaxID=151549 RepID=A0A4C1ZUH5_EUMVA|nr:hypothetical protein EVAR_68284_1 [Eumeta japonica]